MIRFPTPDGAPYSDTYEGGMHCYLVGGFEHIDATLTLTDTDVLVGDDLGHRDSGTLVRHVARHVKPRDVVYGPYRTALYLGQTNASLWREDERRYWRATFDDLTDAGRALVALVDAGNPRILTFLET